MEWGGGGNVVRFPRFLWLCSIAVLYYSNYDYFFVVTTAVAGTTAAASVGG